MKLITDTIDAHILAAKETREGPQTHWYPSSMGGCDRQALLKRAGEPQPPLDTTSLRTFWMGDTVHAALQGVLDKSMGNGYKVLGHELRVRDEEYHVSGRLDTLLERPDGDTELVEWKSIRSTAFKKDLPKPEHVLQLAVYGTFPASRDLGEGDEKTTLFYKIPDVGRIVYWSKDDAQVAEYEIVFTAEIRQYVKDSLRRLDNILAEYETNGTLPPPIAGEQVMEDGVEKYFLRGPKKGMPVIKESWRIRYCPFKGSGKCCGD